MARIRLDTLLHERRLVPSRARGRALVIAGHVHVEGEKVTKAGTLIQSDAEIAIATPDHPYVSRGGVKLAHALDQFRVVPERRTALDVGASTGGFTDVLLRRGARSVVALDVGHGQLDWRLRQDPRVVVLERVHISTATPEELSTPTSRFDIITVDVSFISIRHFIARLPGLLAPQGDLLTLVKPQFEAGRADVGRGGLVTSAEIHNRVINDVTVAATEVGLRRVAMTPSPITGARGNREFFLHLRSAS